MPVAQTLVAISQSSGALKAYTSSISDYGTTLAEGNISYPITGLTSTYQNNELTIYATLTLPSGTTSLVYLWQDAWSGVSGSTPQSYAMGNSNTQAKETLDLVSGASQGGGSSGNSVRRVRNTHGVLNALSWGLLLLLGAIIASWCCWMVNRSQTRQRPS
ncbi:hypothetical protein TanjilG_10109 [Lupinus angustifolius]|uniref:AIR12 DOMON domain-containing protein n=1 Tax=Lupinus angustifolius TaxID=3871 RepID=A0A1J7H2N6_LUPAN|nr:hypothetical protein TanjilG_10109 [Lupinus angustifolius]